ncbi:fimbrillin family protein [uncultured Parabacteroides sp.]|uniref:fimbrillin family protein n=1 Tax=uncultured Parabacteroides sp. TaxID=512312 RepID=UPI00259B19CA|nr:fimbrillin family protein [uncultured Parabacteroides sp.]
MKTLVFNMLTIAATFAAMTACTSESDPVDEVNPKDAKVEIKFNSSITGVETKAAITGTSFNTGSHVGIFALTHTATDAVTWKETNNYMQNVDGTTGNAGAITMTGKHIYPTEGFVSFYAYYPYTSTITCSNGSAPTIPVEIKANEEEQIDYMWATPLLNKTRASATDGAQKLHFQHALSLLDIYVIKATEVTENLSVNLITFKAKNSIATLNISDGTITPGTTTQVTCTTKDNIGSTLTATVGDKPIASFVLLPGENTLSDLSVKIGEKTYSIDAPQVTLTKAQRTKFTITLTSKDITYGSDIEDWTGNGTGQGDI